jgi:hypothetical protein
MCDEATARRLYYEQARAANGKGLITVELSAWEAETDDLIFTGHYLLRETVIGPDGKQVFWSQLSAMETRFHDSAREIRMAIDTFDRLCSIYENIGEEEQLPF